MVSEVLRVCVRKANDRGHLRIRIINLYRVVKLGAYTSNAFASYQSGAVSGQKNQYRSTGKRWCLTGWSILPLLPVVLCNHRLLVCKALARPVATHPLPATHLGHWLLHSDLKCTLYGAIPGGAIGAGGQHGWRPCFTYINTLPPHWVCDGQRVTLWCWFYVHASSRQAWPWG